MADPAEETDDQQSEDDSPRGLRAKIEEQAKRARDASDEAKSLKRENVLLKSKLDHLNERQQKALFADLGEGDLTVEKLQEAAKDLFGAVPAAGASLANAQTDETNEALGQMETFAAGGTSVEPPPPAKEAFAKEVQEWPGGKEELMEFIFARNQHLLDS